MNQFLDASHLLQLSPEEQIALQDWWLPTIQYDDDIVHVFILEEDCTYHGEWDKEYDFTYPEAYTGKLKKHRGTLLPLLSLGEMIAFLHEHDDDNLAFRLHLLLHEGIRETGNRWSFDANTLLTTLWEGVKEVLRSC